MEQILGFISVNRMAAPEARYMLMLMPEQTFQDVRLLQGGVEQLREQQGPHRGPVPRLLRQVGAHGEASIITTWSIN